MAFFLFLVAGYLSPNRWLMLISMSDISVFALVVMICKGRICKWFEGKVNDEFENFGDILKEIIRMLKEESKISKAAEDLFMKFMKNAEEREKKSKES